MKKRFVSKGRKKRKLKLKYAFYVIIFLGVFVYAFLSCQKMNLPLTNEEFLRNLIYHSNHHIPYQYNKKTIITKVMKFFSNINLENPTTILNTTYTGLVDQNEDLDSKENLEELRASSEYIKDPYPNQEVGKPRVYIYNTHQLENYQPSNLAEYNINPNVMMGSYILREKLSNLGIPSMVEEGNITEILQMNHWSYATSYQVSKMFMKDAIEKNPSLEYFIDFHRDSVRRDITFTTINGKNYARILFIVGMENPNYEANLRLTTELNNRLEEAYPGISRGIYKKEGPGVDGVYNQDVSPNVILVEMGGIENHIEEVLNSTEVFAEIFYDYLGDKK